MKVLIQWATGEPRDWSEIDSSRWPALASKPIPGGDEVIDSSPGWVNALNVQGLGFDGYDHYAVEELPRGAVRVTAWSDDPEDWPYKHAKEVVILPLAPDPRFGGAINTKQSFTWYVEDGYPVPNLPIQNTRFLPWSDFAKPASSQVRHGIWLTDELFEAHRSIQTPHGWREWTEGLPNSVIGSDRQVIRQAKFGKKASARGTITYYAQSADRAIGAYVATHEDAFEETTDTAATEDVSLPPADPATSLLGWAFSTPVNEPNSADWPSGTYRFQIDCSANSGVDYGLLTVGTAAGKFARVSSDLSSELGSAVQAQAAFSGTGLKLATVSWDPAAGNAGDRFCCVVACQSTSTKAAKSISLELNEADDYADGPWAAAALVKIMTTETVGIPEAALRRGRSVRLAAETEGLSEVLARRLWSNRFTVETVGIPEVVIKRMWSVRLMTATEGISDIPLRRGRATRIQATEVVGVQETMLRVAGLVRLMAETVGISEGVVRRMWSVRQMIETAGVLDASIRRMRSARQATEAISVQETLLRRGRQVRLTIETVSIPETLLRFSGFVRLMAETVGISETLSRVAGFAKVMTTGVVGISEAAARRMQSVRQMIEAVSISDATARRMWSTRQMASTIGISDSLLRRAHSVRQMVSTVGISDSLLRRARSVRLMAETVSITETFVRTPVLVKIMAATVGVVEAVVRRARSARQTVEVLSVPDVSMRRMWSVRQLAETVSMVENYIRKLYAPYLVKIMDETMTLVDTTARRMRSVRLMKSTLTIVESWVKRGRMVRVMSSVVSLVEGWLSWLWKPVDIIELESKVTLSVGLDSSISTGVDLTSTIAPGVDLESEVS